MRDTIESKAFMDPITIRSERPRRSRLLAAVAGLALVVSGSTLASPATAATTDAAGAQLNIALTGEVDSTNPFIGTLADAMNIHRIQYEPLVAWAPEDNSEHAAIAESWETTDNGKTWIYNLDQNGMWSDGEKITSEDVTWTLTSILEKDALSSAFGAYAKPIEKVTSKDDYTVEVVLKEPQSSNPGTDIPIVPEHVWSSIADPAAHPNDKDVVGSGPFQIASYSVANGATMVANPHYRGGKPGFGTVNLVPFKNTDAAVQALKAGEIDMLSGLTTAQYESLKTDATIGTIAAGGRGFRGLQINPGATSIDGKPMGDGNPVLQDLIFRQALVHAIDRAALNERVLQGYGTAGSGIIPPLYPNYYLSPDSDALLKFDLALANNMLDDAGYAKGPDGFRTDKDGQPINLRLYSYEHAAAQQTLDLVAGWLAEIGIQTTQQITSTAQYNDDTVTGKYDIYVSGWTVRPNPDYLFAMNTCDSRPAADGSGATSLANYCDPEYDKLYADMQLATDPTERADLIKQLQLNLDEAAVFPVMFYADVFQAYRKDKVENVTMQPAKDGSILYQNGAWSLASATPVGATDTAAAAGGDNTGLWIGLGAVALGGVLAAVLLSRRRRDRVDGDEE